MKMEKAQINIRVGADTRKAKSALSELKGSITSLKSFVAGAAGVVGIGIGLAAVAEKAKRIVGSLDEIAASSSNLGVSAEYFQKLDYAAAQTNTDMGLVFNSFARLKKLAGDFMAGETEATDIFSRLGIKREEIKDLAPQELFDRVNAAISAITDNHARARVQADLYGKSTEKMNNFLREYQGLGQDLADRGAIISDADVKAADDLSDSFDRMGRTLTKIVVDTGFVRWLAEFVTYVEKTLTLQKQMKSTQSSAGFVSAPEEDFDKKTARVILNGISGTGAVLGGNLTGNALLGVSEDAETVSYDPSLDPEYQKVIDRNNRLRKMTGLNLKQRTDAEAAAKQVQPVNLDWEREKQFLESLKIPDALIERYKEDWEKKNETVKKITVDAFKAFGISPLSDDQIKALEARRMEREAQWKKIEEELKAQNKNEDEIAARRKAYEEELAKKRNEQGKQGKESSPAIPELTDTQIKALEAQRVQREAQWKQIEAEIRKKHAGEDGQFSGVFEEVARKKAEFFSQPAYTVSYSSKFADDMLSMSAEVKYQTLVAQGKRREAEWLKQEEEYRKQGRKQEEIDQLRAQWEKKYSGSLASEMAEKYRSSLSEIRYNELMAMGKRREAEWSKEEDALKYRGLSADEIAKRRKLFDSEYDSKLKANMSDQTRSTDTEIEYQKMLRTGSKKEAEWYKKQQDMRLEGYGQQEIDAYKSKWEELFRLQQPDIEAKYRATAAIQGSLEEYQLRTSSLGNVNQRQLDALIALNQKTEKTNDYLADIKDKSGEGMTAADLEEGTDA